MIPVTRIFKRWYESWHKILELKALLALQGGNKQKIFGACKRIWHIFVASMIPVTRISSDDMKVGTRLMGHFWALFERKCENEGRKTQSQARIMGYGVFREPTLWQHRRCPLWAEKSKSYSKSCKITFISRSLWRPYSQLSGIRMKCENEGRKAQSQARIMGYGMFREPILWQHCRCPLYIEKSEFYSESYDNDTKFGCLWWT